MAAVPAVPAPRTYLHNIPSISNTIPDFPVLGNLDLNRQVNANSPIDREDLANARAVVTTLNLELRKPSKSQGVTDEMLQHAELRLRAIEGEHIAALYAPAMPQTLAAILRTLDAIQGRLDRIDGRLDGIDGRLDGIDGRLNAMEAGMSITNAMTHNHRIMARNKENKPICEPLRKTVPGHDVAHLLPLLKANDRRGLIAPDPPAPVGAFPPNFNTNLMVISHYTSKEIGKFMIFYNEDFGIVFEDDDNARRMKFLVYLSSF